MRRNNLQFSTSEHLPWHSHSCAYQIGLCLTNTTTPKSYAEQYCRPREKGSQVVKVSQAEEGSRLLIEWLMQGRNKGSTLSTHVSRFPL